MESLKINQDEVVTINLNKFSKKMAVSSILNNIFRYLMIILFLLLIFYQIKKYNELKRIKIRKNSDSSFKYHLYEREMISEKMIKYSGWILKKNEPYFINGIIRKFKPKKCLEIGVARGGSSIIILNALKDISDSFLVSLDLKTLNSVIKIQPKMYVLIIR